MWNIKQINKIKNRTYYFFDDMIKIKDFDSNLLKIAKTSYKKNDICYIGYTTIKDSDCVKIDSVNSLYLIIDKVDVYIEEENESKYSTLVFTDKNKEVLKKYAELWDRIQNLIKKIMTNLVIMMMKNIWKLNLIQMIIYL